jgi:hypothetical protein
MNHIQDTRSHRRWRTLVVLGTLLFLAATAGAEVELTTGRAVYLAACSTCRGR